MTDRMSTEDTKQKSGWRIKQEAMDSTDLRKNPAIQKDETKFKKQTNLVSNMTDRSVLKKAMEDSNVGKEEFAIEINNLPTTMYENQLKDCATGMQLVKCELQMNNFKQEHTGKAIMKIRGTTSDKDILMHTLKNKIGCDAKLKREKTPKKQNMGDLHTPTFTAKKNDNNVF